jgi:hypothetical protein
MATRDNAGNNSNVNKTYGPIAASAKPKPKPAPSPTAVSQLKDVRATLMNIPKDEQGNSLQYTDRDNNIYSGTYKGKSYTWQKGKFIK